MYAPYFIILLNLDASGNDITCNGKDNTKTLNPTTTILLYAKKNYYNLHNS